MQEGSLVCFVDANKSGIFVVDSINEEEYIEKARKGPAIGHSKKVWYLYDKMDKSRRLWKAFEEDIRPHSFDLSRQRGVLNYKVSRSYGSCVGKVRIKPPVKRGGKSLCMSAKEKTVKAKEKTVEAKYVQEKTVKAKEKTVKVKEKPVTAKYVKVQRGESIWHPLDILCEVALCDVTLCELALQKL